MDTYKKTIKDTEIEEKMKKWIGEYTASQEEKNNEIKKIISNTDYMMWLEDFTVDYTAFSTDTWAYFPELISKEHNEKVDMLYLLYQGIEHYASKNYIYPTECDFGEYYNIKLDNTCYEIGRLTGQGTIFFCSRKPFNKDIEYIDFNDIMNDKKRDNAIMIEENLNKLSALVINLYQNGIPLEAITLTLDNTVNEINSKNNLKRKKILKRK